MVAHYISVSIRLEEAYGGLEKGKHLLLDGLIFRVPSQACRIQIFISHLFSKNERDKIREKISFSI